ncbi:glutaredoxin-C9-like [Diospyros lotus]|uniref:glutaredoxin-C9-like n=1 Tax=Diospyros lotus TaxID=55363 RepID=UPI00224F2BF1|nr:glutaredoxin-C9-like [Diospyros lotus]
MQKALPHATWAPPSSSSGAAAGDSQTPQPSRAALHGVKIGTRAQRLVAENAVIVFARRGCCMCHVVKRLLLGHGVNPTVVEIEEQEEPAVIGELSSVLPVGGKDGQKVEFPAVFVGGKLFGGLEKIMESHISGELVPILKKAGALWL